MHARENESAKLWAAAPSSRVSRVQWGPGPTHQRSVYQITNHCITMMVRYSAVLMWRLEG